jgi:hypothetical protein
MKVEEYQNLSWEKKIEFFESLGGKNDKNNSKENDQDKNTPGKIKLPGIDIYNSAFQDPIPSVVLAALNSITGKQTVEFKPRFYQLLKHKNPVVRWKACQKISTVPVEEDLPWFSITFTDDDWMVKECVFSQIRSYAYEKDKKTYFFTIISHLDEKNPQTLKEIYQTLKWYNDERTFPYMYKRMFFAKDSSELIIIMREMASYKSEIVRQRILYLSKKYPDFFVREEAGKLLNSM